MSLPFAGFGPATPVANGRRQIGPAAPEETNRHQMANAQTFPEGLARPQVGRSSVPRVKRRITDYIPLIFILSLLIPYRIEAGPFLLSPNRIFLILILIPCLFMFISGRAGRVRAADYLIFLHALWIWLAFMLAHGAEEALEPAGIHTIELTGSYLIARCCIRSADAFYSIVRILFISIVIMLPFMLAESFTGTHYLNGFFASLGPAITPHFMEPRLGLERTFGVFDHPILLGVYCGVVFALAYYVLSYQSHRIVALIRTGLVAAGAACSLSSGPLLALVAQSTFMAWDHLTRTIRYRWQILGGLFAFMYVLVDLLSNRTPFHVIVSYLTFNTGSAYNRILIWQYGSAEVIRHPFFGIGLGEWERPYWMSNSMDNFWLALAVQGGVPSFLIFAGAILAMCIGITRKRLTDARLIAYRRGWMIAVMGLVVTGATVHYWKTMFCLFVFLIGSAAWMLDRAERTQNSNALVVPVRRRQALTGIPFG